ncbi:MAG: potassium transporter Kup [Gemmatimonadota bacterium]
MTQPTASPRTHAKGDAGSEPPHGAAHEAPRGRALALLAFSTLGVVFGDIGTSPLYALRACFGPRGVDPSALNVLGVLSLVFWSLVLVISINYLAFIMRAHNRGEGGILALMALAVAPKGKGRRVGPLVVLGLFGTALLYGDGLITPAISVLGAMEGLEQVTPALEPLVLPLTLAVLLGLFLIQKRGTAGVSSFFSPVTLVWFLSIAALGAAKIAERPDILAAVNPLHAVRFFLANGVQGFLTLGFVFLVVTGAEALYADMGHFGRPPIRMAWFAIVLPALLLNYFGQGALLLADPSAAENPFYRLVPRPLLYPMIAVATAAAVVASQALISGVFSLTRQALQLGYVPRMTIVHTSGAREGQIYLPSVNLALMVGSMALVLAFRSSDSLASAYGVAVTMTMAITSVLFFFAAQRHLGWPLWRAGLLAGYFLLIDLSFFGANVVKIPDGGWFPLVLAGVLYLAMTIWRDGRAILQGIGQRYSLPLDAVLREAPKLPRVPGVAVFMNAEPEGAPLVLLHHLKHNKALHEHVVLLSIVTESVPAVDAGERVTTRELEQGFVQVTARYGFMESPDVPLALAACEPLNAVYRPGETTYYLGRQTLIPTGRSKMARWRKQVFRVMQRNARPATLFFRLPANRVVELGAQVQF